MIDLPEGVQRVIASLQAIGQPSLPIFLDDQANSSQQVTETFGVDAGQIAICTVFRRKSDDAVVLVITSSDRQLDDRKVKALVCSDGGHVGRADAEFVQAKTGFSIEGVPPIAHVTAVVTLIDASLFRFSEVWAVAGHPQAVFKLTPQELKVLTGALVVDIVVSPEQAEAARQQINILLAARARTVSASGDKVLSPCISVCRINARTGLCEGCYRTLREISGWSRSGSTAQRMLWQIIEQRMADL